MSTYWQLTTAGVTTRSAAALTGVARATATRRTHPKRVDAAPRTMVPANRLTAAERLRVLEVLNSPEFVDQPPLQVYAALLERRQYLCSISTMYRILAEEMMCEVFGIHGIPTVVHADRGTSMTSKSVATLLAELGVTRSHSRPRVSNDNPFSESLFKTTKYLPTFPPTASDHSARPASSWPASSRPTTTATTTPAWAPHGHLHHPG
jgi:putative transposase